MKNLAHAPEAGELQHRCSLMVQLPVRTQTLPPGPETTRSWSGWKGLRESWHQWCCCTLTHRWKLHSSSFVFCLSLDFIIEKTFLQTDPLRFLPGCHCRVRIAVSCLVCHAAWCHQRGRPPGCRRPSASSKPSERRQRLDTPKKVHIFWMLCPVLPLSN